MWKKKTNLPFSHDNGHHCEKKNTHTGAMLINKLKPKLHLTMYSDYRRWQRFSLKSYYTSTEDFITFVDQFWIS